MSESTIFHSVTRSSPFSGILKWQVPWQWQDQQRTFGYGPMASISGIVGLVLTYCWLHKHRKYFLFNWHVIFQTHKVSKHIFDTLIFVLLILHVTVLCYTKRHNLFPHLITRGTVTLCAHWWRYHPAKMSSLSAHFVGFERWYHKIYFFLWMGPSTCLQLTSLHL